MRAFSKLWTSYYPKLLTEESFDLVKSITEYASMNNLMCSSLERKVFEYIKAIRKRQCINTLYNYIHLLLPEVANWWVFIVNIKQKKKLGCMEFYEQFDVFQLTHTGRHLSTSRQYVNGMCTNTLCEHFRNFSCLITRNCWLESFGLGKSITEYLCWMKYMNNLMCSNVDEKVFKYLKTIPKRQCIIYESKLSGLHSST